MSSELQRLPAGALSIEQAPNSKLHPESPNMAPTTLVAGSKLAPPRQVDASTVTILLLPSRKRPPSPGAADDPVREHGYTPAAPAVLPRSTKVDQPSHPPLCPPAAPRTSAADISFPTADSSTCGADPLLTLPNLATKSSGALCGMLCDICAVILPVATGLGDVVCHFNDHIALGHPVILPPCIAPYLCPCG